MSRALCILLLAIFLGPQVGTILVLHEGVCQETSDSDCCPSGGVCDMNCVTCTCCMSSTNLSSLVVLDPVVVVSGPASISPHSIALPLLSTDILHVPKSV